MSRTSDATPARGRFVLSTVIFLALVALPEVAARVLFRLRHAEWPLSQASITQRSRKEAAGLFAEHSILPFVLRPGARLQFMDTVAEIDSNGFRGPGLRASTPLRILLVGGSTTFDTGVTDNSRTWGQKLQEGLQPSLPGTEVVNAGLPVYMLWTNYLKYVLYDRYARPDVVLIYQGINDTLPWWPSAHDPFLRRDYWLFRGVEARAWSGLQGEEELLLAPVLPGWLSHSVFLRGAYNERGRNENVFANMIRARSIEECMPDRYLRRNLDVLGYFIGAIRSDGALPILVPQSMGRGDRKYFASEDSSVWVGGLRKLNSSYLRYAREVGVKAVDVTEGVDGWGDESFKDMAHFNDRGAADFASLLAGKLARDPDLLRLHAKNEGRPAMPTRTTGE